MNLSASSLWRAALCPASAALPHEKREYADAARGVREHAELELSAPSGSVPELAMVWNVLSGSAREVGRSIGRNYGLLVEGDIPGTADLITVLDDSARVTDYKTGNGYAEQLAGVADYPGNNLQLSHNALCATALFGKQKAIVEVVYTRTGEIKEAELDALDLAAARARLFAIWGAANAQDPKVNPDPQRQCWRCPAKNACPIMGMRRR